MANSRSRAATLLLAVLVTLLSGLGVATATESAPDARSSVAVSAAEFAADCGDTSGFEQTPLSTLPKEATDTYNLIKQGGPFPYPEKDGTVFSNREGILPSCASGYYHEYTVPTPGSPDRGARRIVTGNGGEFFYTPDHYESFSVIPV
ncbi:ribonuclease domain-containing protein [Amycolatopsis nigrescens]|uniref:ribonuclease domain-containing protein n=1 Tax=Amycolatopsis nigrescens TaxID=381445 RepID=UPI00036E7897|nr:ribonuclease domain-containing protein [Amycolatopsis nigrescens]